MIAIYRLIDPRTNAVRYVGKTKNPKIRFAAHMRGHLKWVYELQLIGLAPVCDIIEWVTAANANAREYYWIRKLNSMGCDLLNKHKRLSKPISKKSTLKALKISSNLHYRIKLFTIECGLTMQKFIETSLEEELAQKMP